VVRTLVISDLHLGQEGGVSVLTRPRPLEILLGAIPGYDRLVLLGDTIELQEVGASDSVPVAEPILRAIGAALGPDREVLLVPGNHDHLLIREWTLARGESLAREDVVPLDATPLLARVVSWLAPAKVEVRYPAVWLTDRVWAVHGHHLNHYLVPVSSFGVLHPRHRQERDSPRRPFEFEYLPSSLPRPGMRDGLPPPRWHDHVLPKQLSPVMSRLLDAQMRRHALPAMAQAAHALETDADYVIFGHVHRLGPLARDRTSQWLGWDRRQQLLNTGSWRYEPVVSHRTHPPHPYWPGGAVVIAEDGVPRPLGLLDACSEDDFR